MAIQIFREPFGARHERAAPDTEHLAEPDQQYIVRIEPARLERVDAPLLDSYGGGELHLADLSRFPQLTDHPAEQSQFRGFLRAGQRENLANCDADNRLQAKYARTVLTPPPRDT